MAEPTTAPALKVGDIFRCSWGYDQTNVDFYEVVHVSKTGATIRVQEIGQMVDHEGRGYDKVRPDRRVRRGDVMTKRPRLTYRAEWSFKVASYANAYRWDGSQSYQTAQGWGH